MDDTPAALAPRETGPPADDVIQPKKEGNGIFLSATTSSILPTALPVMQKGKMAGQARTPT